MCIRDSQTGEVLVCSFFSNDVLQFDGATGALSQNLVPSGTGDLFVATAMDMAPSGDLFVCSRGNGKILQFDGETGALLAEVGVVFGAHDLAVGPDGDLYVCTIGSPPVVRFDLENGGPAEEFVADGSGGLALPVRLEWGSDGHLYVASRQFDAVFRYDGQSGAFVDLFVTPGDGGLTSLQGMTFGPSGNLYLTSQNTGSILEYDRDTGKFIRVVVDGADPEAPSQPHNIAIDQAGLLYVADFVADSILRYQIADGAFVDVFVAPGISGMNGPEDILLRDPTPRLGLLEPTPVDPAFVAPSVLASYDAVPGEPVFFAAALVNDANELTFQGCPTLTVFLDSPRLLPMAPANGDGIAALDLTFPPSVSGQTLFFQAVAPSSCRVSDVVRFAFP